MMRKSRNFFFCFFVVGKRKKVLECRFDSKFQWKYSSKQIAGVLFSFFALFGLCRVSLAINMEISSWSYKHASII